MKRLISSYEVENLLGSHPVETEWAIREGAVAPADRKWGVDEVVEFVNWLVGHRLRGLESVDGVMVVFDWERVTRDVEAAWPEEEMEGFG